MHKFSILAAVLISTFYIRAEDCGCRSSTRIINPITVPASQFPTVGRVGDNQGTNGADRFFCTGTLIAPRFVLSAAHCLTDALSGRVNRLQNGARFMLGKNSQGQDQVYNSARIYVHPSYHGNSSIEVEGNLDLLVIELDRDVPGVVPTPLFRNTPIVGARLILAGFGREGSGYGGYNNIYPVSGSIDTGYSPIDYVTGTFLKWNFDNNVTNPESNTAPGDSGGPQFINLNNVLYLASVTSGGRLSTAAYGDLAYNTRVDIAANWLDSITGGQPTTSNHPPIVQAPSFTPTQLAINTQATFSVTATDPDYDALRYHWFFGDGTDLITTTDTTQHAFPTDGNYLVQVVVTDGHGGAASQAINLTVGSGGVPVPVLMTEAKHKRFAVYPTRPELNFLDFTLVHKNFGTGGLSSFNALYNGKLANIYIGEELLESFTLNSRFGKGAGTLAMSFYFGTASYHLKNSPRLADLLRPFGAIDSNTSGTISVPLRIKIGNIRYDSNATFNYKAQANFYGIGR